LKELTSNPWRELLLPRGAAWRPKPRNKSDLFENPVRGARGHPGKQNFGFFPSLPTQLQIPLTWPHPIDFY